VGGEDHPLAVADAQRLLALDRRDEPRGVAGSDHQVGRLADHLDELLEVRQGQRP